MRYRSHLVAAALCTALLLASSGSWAQISISVRIAPPALPVYTQPALPGPGYLWAPGYWAWADGGYYWVPGTWVEPPQPGLLWTPGYWGWTDGAYLWHQGYWAPQIGFYGGVNYGFGYDGIGFVGGYWLHGAFFYNRAVYRIPGGPRFAHVYSRPVPPHASIRTSFNGGQGGIQVRASAAQLAVERGRHIEPVAAQRQQEQAAGRNPELRATANHGRPPIGATPRPGQFNAGRAPATHGNVRIPERTTTHSPAGAAPGAAARPARPVANPAIRPEAPRGTAPHQAKPHQAPAHAAPAKRQEPQDHKPDRQPQ